MTARSATCSAVPSPTATAVPGGHLAPVAATPPVAAGVEACMWCGGSGQVLVVPVRSGEARFQWARRTACLCALYAGRGQVG